MRTCLEVCNRLKGDSISKEDEGKSSHRLNKPSTFIRAHVDLRDNYSPGWKFNHWELKVFTFNCTMIVVNIVHNNNKKNEN